MTSQDQPEDETRALDAGAADFITKPFQNWTRENARLIGVAFFYVDYEAPIDRLRTALDRLVAALVADGHDAATVETHVSEVRTDPWTFTVGATGPGVPTTGEHR